jgi:hypothetical protein
MANALLTKNNAFDNFLTYIKSVMAIHPLSKEDLHVPFGLKYFKAKALLSLS